MPQTLGASGGGADISSSDSGLKGEFDRLFEPIRRRRDRAEELVDAVPRGRLYVALCSVGLSSPEFTLVPDCVLLRRITNPPSFLDVMSAGRPGSVDSLAIGRDAQEITGELVLNGPEGDSDPDFLLDLAFHAAVLLRLRCASSTYAPAAADVSWDTVAAHDGDVRFVGLDEPASRVTASAHDFPVNQVDAEWVSASFVPALRLRDFEHSRRFGLAFNIAYAWNHSSDPRLAIANIWVGLEALFGDQGDRPVTRNLVRRISEWNGCDADEVTGLYNVRCDAVHGRWVETADLAAPIDAAWQLLRQSLVRAIDVEDVPLPDWGAGV